MRLLLRIVFGIMQRMKLEPLTAAALVASVLWLLFAVVWSTAGRAALRRRASAALSALTSRRAVLVLLVGVVVALVLGGGHLDGRNGLPSAGRKIPLEGAHEGRGWGA